MTVQEMAEACGKAIERESDRITFVLPGYSRGNFRRLFGRAGPKGEVIADTGTDDRPESLVAFDPISVLAYLSAKGLVQVEVKKPV